MLKNGASRPRKKLRKGTHSCTECRRRRIKCTFPNGSVKCTACLDHDSDCIDQREAITIGTIPQPSSIGRNVPLPPLSTNVQSPRARERVDNPSQAFRNGIIPDSTMSTSFDQRAPFVSALNEAELLLPSISNNLEDVQMTGSSSKQHQSFQQEKLNQSTLVKRSHKRSRDHELCIALRSHLPSFDMIMAALEENGKWWDSFNSKIHSDICASADGLIEFARKVYTTNNPTELATLVTAYARSTSGNNHLYDFVDRTVISDMKCLETIEGLNCLILLGKSYIDVGEPKRAWLLYRRGIAMAQILGLSSKSSTSSSDEEKIWWTLYSGDRFTSLLLGLPYGIIDAHHDLTVDSCLTRTDETSTRFVQACAVIIGRLLDHRLTHDPPSVSILMSLNSDLDRISFIMPEKWWNIHAADSNATQKELREALLFQISFYHIRMYLLLPFLIKSPLGPPQGPSQSICMAAAYAIIERILILRAGSRSSRLFECRTMDFVGFVAAIVLLLGNWKIVSEPSPLRGYPQLSFSTSLQIVKSFMSQLEEDVEEIDSDVLSQYRESLSLLIKVLEPASSNVESVSPVSAQIKLPYFGVVIRKPPNYSSTQNLPSQQLEEDTTRNHEDVGLLRGSNESTNTQIVDTLILTDFSFTSVEDESFWETEQFESFSLDNLFPWLDST